ncbi:hypothetical protein DFQ00_102487 [Paenibacillus barcinonensis]|uniref:Uncharacterized protein n=1 Tax=Paenibacillus barcinonensis TaxID=198119 RepID=A0A2V4VPB5_PAEBA|nr:hypothetical protein DFQ00_102487 [Paenibacillus barcinonensis]
MMVHIHHNTTTNNLNSCYLAMRLFVVLFVTSISFGKKRGWPAEGWNR